MWLKRHMCIGTCFPQRSNKWRSSIPTREMALLCLSWAEWRRGGKEEEKVSFGFSFDGNRSVRELYENVAGVDSGYSGSARHVRLVPRWPQACGLPTAAVRLHDGLSSRRTRGPDEGRILQPDSMRIPAGNAFQDVSRGKCIRLMNSQYLIEWIQVLFKHTHCQNDFLI